MGTIICLHVALRNPKLVKSLALLGPLLAPADAGRQGLRERAAVARAQGMQPVADAVVQASTAAASRREQPVTVALIREMLMRQDAEGYARTCEALAAAEPADAARIACPTLLVAGDEDAVASASGARALAERIAGARVQVVMTAGAQQFVTPLTLQALSGQPVATDTFSLTQESEIGHIQLADTAEAIVIVPATANVLAESCAR